MCTSVVSLPLQDRLGQKLQITNRVMDWGTERVLVRKKGTKGEDKFAGRSMVEQRGRHTQKDG